MSGKRHLLPQQKFRGSLKLDLLSGVGQSVRLHLQQKFSFGSSFRRQILLFNSNTKREKNQTSATITISDEEKGA